MVVRPVPKSSFHKGEKLLQTCEVFVAVSVLLRSSARKPFALLKWSPFAAESKRRVQDTPPRVCVDAKRCDVATKYQQYSTPTKKIRTKNTKERNGGVLMVKMIKNRNASAYRTQESEFGDRNRNGDERCRTCSFSRFWEVKCTLHKPEGAGAGGGWRWRVKKTDRKQ